MTKKGLIKLIIIIMCSLLLFYLIIEKLSGFNVYKNNNFDKYISTEIKHPDGTVNYYESGVFPLVNKGDTVYAKVDLPLDRYINDSAICFYAYHSVIDVYDEEGNLLYEYGDNLAKEEDMIGGTYVFAHIPNEAWGKSLTIKLQVQKDKAFSRIQGVVILDSLDAYKYLIGDKEPEFMIFLTIFVISVISLFILILERKWSSIVRQGIYLLSFLCSISLWLLEYNGMINLFTNNKVLAADIGYIGLLISPVMLALFFYEQSNNIKTKRIHLYSALIFGVFSLVCILLNYTTVNYHYSKTLYIFHILLGIIIILELYQVIKHSKIEDLSGLALKYGGLIYLVIILLELIRYYIYKNTNYYVVALTRNLFSIAIMVLIVSIILSYATRLANYYIDEYEKGNLEKLAYYDALTGIPNRTGCYRHFESLKSSNENAIVFIDVNDLKYANDVFGHGMGDMLIRFIAETLEKAFKNHGFYGRFGGDEFVAIISSKKVKSIYECMDAFNEELAKANEESVFPFEVSVSYGISVSSKEDPLTIDQLIINADKIMYQNKKKKKLISK